MRILRELWRRVSGRASAEAMVEESIATFPGKCMICSFHRCVLGVGPPGPHHCIERENPYLPEGYRQRLEDARGKG